MSTLAPILVPATDADADYVCTAGTAILSKVKPLSVDYTLPGHPDAAAVKGRIVTLEFESCYLVGTYVVNAGTGLKGFKYYVEAEDADIIVLTETKVNNDPVDPALTQRYPHRHWAISNKKTYLTLTRRRAAKYMGACGAE